MMVALLLMAFCVVFVELFIRWRLVDDIRAVISFSRKGVAALSASDMDDDEKEVFIRRQSLEIFKATFFLAVKLLAISVILYAIYFSICYFRADIGERIFENFQSLPALVILTVATMIYVWLRSSFAQNYNLIDRLLHHLAFSTPVVQKMLVELEDDFYKRQIKDVASQNEVFITGLPRSGTTLMLEMLYGTTEFGSFTYRHMPFVLSPLLWTRVSASFQKKGGTAERAHGDGMVVSYDSPEAFEEIIWLFYMQAKIVSNDRLSPLSAGDQTPEFEEGFKNSVRKLLVRHEGQQPLRYLSKNNANVSRIDLLHELFPTASIVIPFRQPLAHVGSLMKQHHRFSELHQKDSFAKRYMKWLGHYDFGENLKPINFDRWLDDETVIDGGDANFWLKYWTVAYSHVLEHLTDNVILVDFDKLLSDGENTLTAIADRLGLTHKERLVEAATTLRPPTSSPIPSVQFKPETMERAARVHERLRALAV